MKIALTVLALFAAGPALAGYTQTRFPAAQWGLSDASLGFAGGAVLEDFEDTALSPGLSLGWTASPVLVTMLPRTFDPRPTAQGGDDPNGSAFWDLNGIANTSLWDGSRVLVSGNGNQTYGYNSLDPNQWGSLSLSFATPLSSVGFSLQQNERAIQVFVNGVAVPALDIAGGYAGRNGYFRFDATGGDSISSLRLVNGTGDGWAIDHLLMVPVPEPASWGLMAAGLLLLAARRPKRPR